METFYQQQWRLISGITGRLCERRYKPTGRVMTRGSISEIEITNC